MATSARRRAGFASRKASRAAKVFAWLVDDADESQATFGCDSSPGSNPTPGSVADVAPKQDLQAQRKPLLIESIPSTHDAQKTDGQAQRIQPTQHRDAREGHERGMATDQNLEIHKEQTEHQDAREGQEDGKEADQQLAVMLKERIGNQGTETKGDSANDDSANDDPANDDPARRNDKAAENDKAAAGMQREKGQAEHEQVKKDPAGSIAAGRRAAERSLVESAGAKPGGVKPPANGSVAPALVKAGREAADGAGVDGDDSSLLPLDVHDGNSANRQAAIQCREALKTVAGVDGRDSSLLPLDVRERIKANRQAAIERRAERLRQQVEGGVENGDKGKQQQQHLQDQQQQQRAPSYQQPHKPEQQLQGQSQQQVQQQHRQQPSDHHWNRAQEQQQQKQQQHPAQQQQQHPAQQQQQHQVQHHQHQSQQLGPLAPLQVSLELVSADEFCLFADWVTNGTVYKEYMRRARGEGGRGSGGSGSRQFVIGRENQKIPVTGDAANTGCSYNEKSVQQREIAGRPQKATDGKSAGNRRMGLDHQGALAFCTRFVKAQPIRWQHVATEASRGVTRLVPVFPLRFYDSLLFTLRSIPPFQAFQPLLPNQLPDQSRSIPPFQAKLPAQGSDLSGSLVPSHSERVSVGVRIQGVPVSTLAALRESKERERLRGMVETAEAVADAEAGEAEATSRGVGANLGSALCSSAAGDTGLEDGSATGSANGSLPGLAPGSAPGLTIGSVRGSARSVLDREMERRLPGQLRRALLPFQREGVKFAVQRGGRCLIADEMGVGKTIQAIAAAAWYMAEGPVLIVCPACLRLQWAEQLERWLPFLRPSQIHVVFGQRDDLVEEDPGEGSPGVGTDGSMKGHTDKANGRGALVKVLQPCPATSKAIGQAPAVVITSFTMAGRLRRTLMRRRGGWGMVIVDEAHVLRTGRKPYDCLETRVVVDVIRRTKRAILLTGTPSLSRPFDMFNLVDSLWPGLLGMSKYEFARNYCDRERDSKDFSRGIRLRELHILLSHTVMIRRLKSEVVLQLPPKRRQVIRLRLEPVDVALAVQRVAELSGGDAVADANERSEDDGAEGEEGGEGEDEEGGEETGEGVEVRGGREEGREDDDDDGDDGDEEKELEEEKRMGECGNKESDAERSSEPRIETCKAGNRQGKSRMQAAGEGMHVRRSKGKSGRDSAQAATTAGAATVGPPPMSSEGGGGGLSTAPGSVSGGATDGKRALRARRGRVSAGEEEGAGQRSERKERKGGKINGRMVEKMVIFAHHHVVMDALQAAVYRIAAASILGSGAEGEEGSRIAGGEGEGEEEGAEEGSADGNSEGRERGSDNTTNFTKLAKPTESAKPTEPAKPAKAAMQFELVRVDGTTPPLERAEAVKRFVTEPQVRVAIVGVTAGGVGLDFSAAQTIVFAEIPRAAADLLQGEDRAHRRGQRFPVNVVVFCAKDSRDETAWQKLCRSAERVSAAVDGGKKHEVGLHVDSVIDQSAVKRARGARGIEMWQRTAGEGGKQQEVGLLVDGGKQREGGLLVDSVIDQSAVKRARGERGLMEDERGNMEKGYAREDREEASEEGGKVTTRGATGVEKGPDSSSGYEMLGMDSPRREVGSGSGKGVGYHHTGLREEVKGAEEDAEAQKWAQIRPEGLRFEVSTHTGRIHLFFSHPGRPFSPVPLEQNFHPEDLDLVISTPLCVTGRKKQHDGKAGADYTPGDNNEGDSKAEDDQCDKNESDRNNNCGNKKGDSSKKEGSSAGSPQLVDSEDRMPPILRRHVALREAARSFVSEWGALKPQHRRKLLGRVLALPVAEELERMLFPLPFGEVMGMAGTCGSKRRWATRGDILTAAREGRGVDGGGANGSRGAGVGTSAAAGVAAGGVAAGLVVVERETRAVRVHGRGTRMRTEWQLWGRLGAAVPGVAGVAGGGGGAGGLAGGGGGGGGEAAGGVAAGGAEAAATGEVATPAGADKAKAEAATEIATAVTAAKLATAEAVGAPAEAAAAERAGGAAAITARAESETAAAAVEAETEAAVADAHEDKQAAPGGTAAGVSSNERLPRGSIHWVPLCRMCGQICRTHAARAPTVLRHLFCSESCFSTYLSRTSLSFLRQELFSLERGVCVTCNLDCHTLVAAIRVLPPSDRRRVILHWAPQFSKHPKLLQRLVDIPAEGNAWHADHIVAVAEGGGECGVENLRTLCVACHQEHTNAQRRKWAEERKRARAALMALEAKRRRAGEGEGGKGGEEGKGGEGGEGGGKKGDVKSGVGKEGVKGRKRKRGVKEGEAGEEAKRSVVDTSVAGDGRCEPGAPFLRPSAAALSIVAGTVEKRQKGKGSQVRAEKGGKGGRDGKGKDREREEEGLAACTGVEDGEGQKREEGEREQGEREEGEREEGEREQGEREEDHTKREGKNGKEVRVAVRARGSKSAAGLTMFDCFRRAGGDCVERKAAAGAGRGEEEEGGRTRVTGGGGDCEGESVKRRKERGGCEGKGRERRKRGRQEDEGEEKGECAGTAEEGSRLERRAGEVAGSGRGDVSLQAVLAPEARVLSGSHVNLRVESEMDALRRLFLPVVHAACSPLASRQEAKAFGPTRNVSPPVQKHVGDLTGGRVEEEAEAEVADSLEVVDLTGQEDDEEGRGNLEKSVQREGVSEGGVGRYGVEDDGDGMWEDSVCQARKTKRDGDMQQTMLPQRRKKGASKSKGLGVGREAMAVGVRLGKDVDADLAALGPVKSKGGCVGREAMEVGVRLGEDVEGGLAGLGDDDEEEGVDTGAHKESGEIPFHTRTQEGAKGALVFEAPQKEGDTGAQKERGEIRTGEGAKRATDAREMCEARLGEGRNAAAGGVCFDKYAHKKPGGRREKGSARQGIVNRAMCKELQGEVPAGVNESRKGQVMVLQREHPIGARELGQGALPDVGGVDAGQKRRRSCDVENGRKIECLKVSHKRPITGKRIADSGIAKRQDVSGRASLEASMAAGDCEEVVFDVLQGGMRACDSNELLANDFDTERFGKHRVAAEATQEDVANYTIAGKIREERGFDGLMKMWSHIAKVSRGSPL
ncbi:hypothetical protein CLOP_g7415 [Closterium sp. NIES-67]|nr:hypothetical protein CLOP_g7415 [Closterium sp. NIES-67]